MIPDDLQVPGYDIEERIGKGGMASVYRARQHTFDRDVALKVLKPDLSEDESFCQRFVQESLIVAKLHHSNIVQVYDVGEFRNNFYIAMEYLHGGDLNTRLAEGIAIKDTISIIKQAASALNFAHQKGIVHRDIKPDNIMFREDGAAVLTDFGIAKELDSDLNLTQTGLIVGTPKYMAPEQIRGDTATPQSDIYALGILLFQCLTDHVPFEGNDMVATAYKHFNDPVPNLPPLVAAFQPILERMLAKELDERYEHPLQVIDALEELSGEAKNSGKTNLDVTDEYDLPASTLDPTLVHSDTEDAAPRPEDATVAMTPAMAYADTVQTDIVESQSKTETRSELSVESLLSKKRAWLIASALLSTALIIIASLWFTLLAPGHQPKSATSLQANSNASVTENAANLANIAEPKEPKGLVVLSQSQKVTIERLLEEAQFDIAAQRLKKPDADNAFNKLQRVLALEPENARANAAMEQISEEYAKLADRSIGQRQYRAAEIFLDDARSASSSLDVIATLQTKLHIAKRNQSEARESIESMERSLMIEGLLKSAALDEDEGRLRYPTQDNALDKYLRVLELDENNRTALSKIEELRP